MSFYIKKGDLEPDLEVQVQDTARNPFDLTGFSGAVLRWELLDGTTVERSMSVLNEATGDLVYLWQAGDTDTVAVYKAEVVVTWPGGEKQTFPSRGYFTFEVTDPLPV